MQKQQLPTCTKRRSTEQSSTSQSSFPVENSPHRHLSQDGVQTSIRVDLPSHQSFVDHHRLAAVPHPQPTEGQRGISTHIDQDPYPAHGLLDAIEPALGPTLLDLARHQEDEEAAGTALDELLVEEEGARAIVAIAVMMIGAEVEAGRMEGDRDIRV